MLALMPPDSGPYDLHQFIAIPSENIVLFTNIGVSAVKPLGQSDQPGQPHLALGFPSIIMSM